MRKAAQDAIASLDARDRVELAEALRTVLRRERRRGGAWRYLDLLWDWSVCLHQEEGEVCMCNVTLRCACGDVMVTLSEGQLRRLIGDIALAYRDARGGRPPHPV